MSVATAAKALRPLTIFEKEYAPNDVIEPEILSKIDRSVVDSMESIGDIHRYLGNDDLERRIDQLEKNVASLIEATQSKPRGRPRSHKIIQEND